MPKSRRGAVNHALINTRLVDEGGEVSLIILATPHDLLRLYSNVDEEGAEYRRNVHAYNNSLAFSCLGATYDTELTKNTKRIYTFHVQGQAYHFLNSLKHFVDAPSDASFQIQLYFYDIDEELSKRLDAQPRLRESTIKLLMNILGANPYAKFFKDFRNIPYIEDQIIVINSNLGLNQRLYNLPFSSQVATIWTESDDQPLHRNAHTQWMISTETLVELSNEQDDMLLAEFKCSQFRNLTQYTDLNNQTVDALGVVIDALSVFPVTKDNKTSMYKDLSLSMKNAEGQTSIGKVTNPSSNQTALVAKRIQSHQFKLLNKEALLQVLVCLVEKFETIEDAKENASEDDESKKTKKAKLT
ncbi:hypothetical protein ACH5RR_026277 [Cinchona calisaya]|uniref:Uncharacterized protein n=1 Tax=Cinchona calisaya TaxID=153742 RepID=A0ABD2Z241_9GENT